MSTSPETPDRIITIFSWDDALEALYASWRRRVDAAERVHQELATRLARRHAALGTLAIVAIVLVGGIVLAPVVAPDAYSRATDWVDPDIVSIVGASLAAVAAVLLIVQAAAGFAVRAEDHRIAALRFASLGRTMAITVATPREGRESPDDALAEVRRRVDRYSRESPPVGLRRRRKVNAAFERSATPSGESTTDDPVSANRSFAAT
jgi:hypothetical protein